MGDDRAVRYHYYLYNDHSLFLQMTSIERGAMALNECFSYDMHGYTFKPWFTPIRAEYPMIQTDTQQTPLINDDGIKGLFRSLRCATIINGNTLVANQGVVFTDKPEDAYDIARLMFLDVIHRSKAIVKNSD